jgi:pyrroloquinoline quinone (PQQ) biosynthesis protein C
MYALDGAQFPLTDTEASHLLALAPRLTGRLPLNEAARTAEDTALIQQLHQQGAVFDLPITGESVPTSQFCDYLYTRITNWRTHKHPGQWPWRGVIANGQATVGYLQGILIENYHYVHAAAVRQSPLLSHAASPVMFDLIRDFVTGEADHEGYFLETLARWGLPTSDVQHATPLTSTAAFIALQYRLAHLSILDYLAGSATLEVEPQVYEREGDPYHPWEAIYGVEPEVLAPVRQHIRDDVESGHSQLFRAVALEAAPAALPLETATSALLSARTVFQATRLWQRDTYEHYQLSGGNLGRTSL